MQSVIATVKTVSSVNLDFSEKSSKLKSRVLWVSYTDPIISPAIAPIIVLELRFCFVLMKQSNV